MTDRSEPPVKRFRTKIDMRFAERKVTEPVRSTRRHGLVRCERCKTMGESILIKAKLSDGTEFEDQRCEKCLHTEPRAVEILKWGTEG